MGIDQRLHRDGDGRPVYDWTIVDRIFDTLVERKMKPIVEIGFMPEALSTRPVPYRHDWVPGADYGRIYTGWTYPPTDYEKWRELVFQWARHSVARYGRREVESWYWEVWNEPDIGYWHGSVDDYLLVWNYHDDDLAAPAADVEVTIAGVPDGRPLVTEYRIDRTHSNAYEAWQRAGAPQPPAPALVAALREVGRLQVEGQPARVATAGGRLQLRLTLPRQAVSLLAIHYSGDGVHPRTDRQHMSGTYRRIVGAAVVVDWSLFEGIAALRCTLGWRFRCCSASRSTSR